MNLRLILFYFAVISLSAANAFSQNNTTGNYQKQGFGTGSVKGIVINASTSTPLEYCYVVLYKQSDSSLVSGSITDSTGHYLIEKVPFGKYYLSLNLIGHKPLKIPDVLLNPKNADITWDTIRLSPNTGMLEAVEIKDKRSTIEFSLDKKIVNVEKNLVSVGGTAIDVMQTIPSVTVDVDGNMSMRGNSNITVLIDGKPSSLTGASRSAMLEQIPASSIESIEIISNPSAKYDPDGMTGIINIILKKKKEKGYNGAITFNAGTGDKYNGSAGINLNKKFMNLFGNYDFRIARSNYYSNMQRSATLDDTLSKYDAYNKGDRKRNSHNFKFGTDIYFNKQNNLTLSALYSISESLDREHGTSTYLNASDIVYDYYTSENTEDGKDHSRDLNLDYKHSFKKKGEYLTFNGIYSKGISSETNDLNTTQYLPDMVSPYGNPLVQRGVTDENSYVTTLQSDFVNPINSKSRFECGLKSIVRELDNKYTLKDLNDSSDLWIYNGLSNRFLYDEQIHAGYAIYSNTIGKFEFQAGLRAEQVFTKSSQKTSGIVYDRDYFSLYPTMHLNLNLKHDNSFQLSYSRRVNRPMYHMLNPFVDVSQPGTRHYGNPYLLPEYIDSYELGHLKYWGKTSVNSSLFYKQINNAIQRTVFVDSLGIQNMTPKNIAQGISYGAEFIFSYEIGKLCKLNGTLSYFRTIMKGNEDGEELTNSNYSWTGKLNATISPIKTLDIQITGNYRAPMVVLQGTMDAMYYADIAVKKDIFKSKASISARLSDIFNTQQFNMHQTGSNFDIQMQRKRESRIFYLGFTYKINGGDKVKDKKKAGDSGGYDGMDD